LDFRPTLQKGRQLFTFPDNFTEIRPEISKVGLLSPKSPDFFKAGATLLKSV